VPVACCPPVTEVGEIVKLSGPGGATVKLPFTEPPPALAVMVTSVAVATGAVLNVNNTTV
jgi:hypothetical protein